MIKVDELKKKLFINKKTLKKF